MYPHLCFPIEADQEYLYFGLFMAEKTGFFYNSQNEALKDEVPDLAWGNAMAPNLCQHFLSEMLLPENWSQAREEGSLYKIVFLTQVFCFWYNSLTVTKLKDRVMGMVPSEC